MNRHRKGGKDAAEWLPARNRCWFAARVVEIRLAYGLTIAPRETAVLEQILARCDSTDMEPMACTAHPVSVGHRNEAAGDSRALAMYDDNGRITCKEARRHGIPPVRSDHPASVHAGWRQGRGGLRVSGPVDWGLALNRRRPLTVTKRSLNSSIGTDAENPHSSPRWRSPMALSGPVRPQSSNGGAAIRVNNEPGHPSVFASGQCEVGGTDPTPICSCLNSPDRH